VGVGAPNKGRLLGPVTRAVKALLLSRTGRPQVTFFLAKPSRGDLAELRDLLLGGRISPVIDRTYTLSGAPEAIRYLERGHARGKVVITVLRGRGPACRRERPCGSAAA